MSDLPNLPDFPLRSRRIIISMEKLCNSVQFCSKTVRRSGKRVEELIKFFILTLFSYDMVARFIIASANSKIIPIAFLLASVAPISLKAQAAENDVNFIITPSVGYAVEDFVWSIGGKNSQGENVDVLSELKWKKTGGFRTSLKAEFVFVKNFFVRMNKSNTFITSGTVTDTDFGKQNRTDTTFHGQFSSNKGRVRSLDLTVGYKLRFSKNFTVLPFAGYGNNSQSLYILKDFGNVQGNLRSTYRTKWNGFIAGSEIDIPITKRVIVAGNIAYHQLRYAAKADWNLIEAFQHPVSFKHSAKGYCISNELAVRYRFNLTISASIIGNYNYWTTGKGTDTLYLADGNINVTQLNSIFRNGVSISAGIQISF